ncbi:hypothetical protein ACFFGV_09385 [Pontibacillus salicampi]|uniref:DoxX family membrane protein n=1 Tax=Pontibacillus salicampi TaxID=1449801 RepID=A0ABV6LN21_9BACI
MKRLGLWLFTVFFFTAGVMHFIVVDSFVTIVPAALPAKEWIVYVTGVMEIVLAIGLLLPNTRRISGKMIALFLVLVFPANIYSAIAGIPATVNPMFLWIRLLFQPLLIWWVWAVSKE